MSPFEVSLAEGKFSKNERAWFPRWIRRFHGFLREERISQSDLSCDTVVSFLRRLVDNQVPAWQRQQAAKAIGAYEVFRFRRQVNGLSEVIQKLGQIARQERFLSGGQPSDNDVADLIGNIDPAEPEVIQMVRRECRVTGLMRRTEIAYVGWIKRFLGQNSAKLLKQVTVSSSDLPNESAIRDFLTDVVVAGNVAQSTQGQAKSALLFLYQRVFGQQLGFIDAVGASRPARLPVVLSREEVAKLLPEFPGLKQTMFLLMYGAGLRHLECRRLRIKDICFDEGHIVVRNGKGDQDRITVLRRWPTVPQSSAWIPSATEGAAEVPGRRRQCLDREDARRSH